MLVFDSRLRRLYIIKLYYPNKKSPNTTSWAPACDSCSKRSHAGRCVCPKATYYEEILLLLISRCKSYKCLYNCEISCTIWVNVLRVTPANIFAASIVLYSFLFSKVYYSFVSISHPDLPPPFTKPQSD